MHNPHYPYRPDVDGLRALAVACVIAYHAFPTLAPGGFVGVDIFFVISGFLITGIIRREMVDSTFSIGGFYGRRAKRLFPALAVVLAATLLIGWGVLFGDEYRRLGKHVAAGVAFVSNFAFWAETGYFDAASELKPLLHLWSLGVEEQFYIVWPLIIAFTFRARLNFLVVAATLGLLSFAAGVALVDTKPASAFFLPHPRFWELMVGGLLAAAAPMPDGRATPARDAPSTPDRFRAVREALALIGLSLIGLAVALVNEDVGFPGWWALLPTTGAALLIGAGPRTWISGSLMSRRVVVLVGLISYPLYLWHWPLLSFARIIADGEPPLAVRIGLVAATIGLAWATYRYVETPIRALAGRAGRSRAVVAGLATAMFVFFCAGLMVRFGVIHERLRDVSSLVGEARNDWHYPGDDKAAVAGISDEAVLFFGDSFISQLYPRIKYLAGEHPAAHRAVRFYTAAGCRPLRGVARRSRSRCLSYSSRGYDLAASPNVKTVVIGGHWLALLKNRDYFDAEDPKERRLDFSREADLALVLGRFEADLSRLKSLGKAIYVVLNPPGGERADPGVIEAGRMSMSPEVREKSIPLADHIARTAVINGRISAAAQRAGATVIDPAGWLCGGDRCVFTDPKGMPYFRDSAHLRASFVRCCVKEFDQLVLINAR